MSHSKKSRAVAEKKMEDELTEKQSQASSTMKLAMDTLDRGLEAIRSTHRSARRLRTAVEEIELPIQVPRLVAVKK